MRYLVLATFVVGCSAAEPMQTPAHDAPAPRPAVVGPDMAPVPPGDMADVADMAPTPTQTAPSSGVQLGSVCTYAQQCTTSEFGAGRCIVDVSGIGHCTTAIYFPSMNKMNYCLSVSPSKCCLSDVTNDHDGVEVTGVYADWITGVPTGAGSCDLGAFAPWIP